MVHKVMTFNLRVDIPQDGSNAWENREKKVTQLINNHQPAIIGTQEGLLRMIKDIEEDLPDYQWIGNGRRGGMADEFCAIFYHDKKLDVVEKGQFWLSEQPDTPNSISWESDFPRICTWGHFRFKNDGTEFIVYNTHLDHISQEARENGIHLIWKRLLNHYDKKKIPIILTGDFNSEPSNPVVRFLRGEAAIMDETVNLQDAFIVLNEPIGRTFHGFNGGTEGEPIDYIFASPEIKVLQTDVDRSTVDNVYPSDHYPIISTLEIN
ncbi:endonuclease/exonuclease/phosphatase family protein [Bacillus sp. CH30_1T]|uniref:endonuclease/exonuclease/phosphatase family protein n=1 Tax=Bacillus sp. CH30_1T TaxID=2604836 RepID=UPI0011EBB259|nr:endonuclease/exonuclease/phosphatase family protein [Bacillus sp. CH30_1T]KAA0561218.1 endonuclease/exonuclease/phosphatase family protein [Bacillus sp. CH30_1T]